MIIPNKRQKITAITFATIITLMCLFPPTRVTHSQPSLDSNKLSYHETTSSGGFRFIGHLETEGYLGYLPKKSYSIDTAQLFLQVLVACLAGVAMLYVLNDPQKKD